MRKSKPVVAAEKIIVDADLVEFYGVPAKRLNEQVKRNSSRFPPDFMFPLTQDEKSEVAAYCDHLNKIKIPKRYLTFFLNMVPSWLQVY
jgi:hypothetical protein